MYYCYILYSLKLDKYYIGSSSDLEDRLYRHNHSRKGFTATGQPWELKYYECFKSRKEAFNRELNLKKMKDRRYLEALISQGSSASR
ncbi:GIY-YIG nuclease family protein [Roseimarinus sediminis]|uniref:GIY-YIG nuclease family protein n=1 Tax=Roseimarinus sediminis TaxID=1610899 RepID=UPI003D1BFF8D